MRILTLQLPVVASLSVLLGACAMTTSSGDIVALGQDTYAVNSESFSLFQGQNYAAANGALKAQAFCRKQGKEMEVTGSDASPPVTGVQISKTLLMFKCVN